jgi:hypothetical protein
VIGTDEVLECGHSHPFIGEKGTARRCRKCKDEKPADVDPKDFGG